MRLLWTVLVCALPGLCIIAEEPLPVAAPEKSDAPQSEERVIRERFLVAYQTAEKPERKAETVEMLRGLKEKESHRLIAGMLADKNELVRKTACMVMITTRDADGYFVKPLMGALNDSKISVRMAAADAMASAVIRADAIKALTYALMGAVGSSKKEVKGDDAKVLEAYDKALEVLTGEKSPNRDLRNISSYWMDYWKKHEDELRAADAKLLEQPDPVRPEGLAKDSLDKLKPEPAKKKRDSLDN
jgi:hypothetical protein